MRLYLLASLLTHVFQTLVSANARTDGQHTGILQYRRPMHSSQQEAARLVEKFVQHQGDDDVRLNGQVSATIQLRQDLHGSRTACMSSCEHVFQAT